MILDYGKPWRCSDDDGPMVVLILMVNDGGGWFYDLCFIMSKSNN